MPLLRRPAIPRHRLTHILRDAIPRSVEITKGHLRLGMPLLRRPAIPRHRFGLCHAHIVSIQAFHEESRLGLTSLRCAAVPPHRRNFALRQRPAIPRHRH